MTKMILRDKTEIQIYDGASLSSITTKIDNYIDIIDLIIKLTPGNLSDIQFINESEELIAKYTDMVLNNGSISISVDSDPVIVNFGIRERTLEEKRKADVDIVIKCLSDEQAIIVKDLYPFWSVYPKYEIGDRIQYDSKLYKCLKDHQAQLDWTPDAATSLWAEILTEPGEILPWKQPDSTNGYHKGDKVTHKGQTWESDIDNNVWEPGAIGTESLWHTI